MYRKVYLPMFARLRRQSLCALALAGGGCPSLQAQPFWRLRRQPLSSPFPLPLSFLLPCHSLTYVSLCLHTARHSVCNLQAPDNNAGLQAASVAVWFSYAS